MTHLLSILVFLPGVGAISVLVARGTHWPRRLALAFSVATVALALVVDGRCHGRPTSRDLAVDPSGIARMVEQVRWLPGICCDYFLGIDGLSLPVVVLTALLTPLAVMNSAGEDASRRNTFAMILLTETCLLGTFLSLDLLLFSFFFIGSIAPTCLPLVGRGMWRHLTARMRVTSMSLIFAVPLLIGVAIIARHTGSLDLLSLPKRLSSVSAPWSHRTAQWAFGLFLASFLFRMGAVPMHWWLPDLLTEAAPSQGLLAASIFPATGGYSLLRVVLPLCPQAAQHLWPLAALLGIVTILYTTLLAVRAADLRRFVAYVSISQAGYLILGAAMLTPAAIEGAHFLLIASAVSTSLLLTSVNLIEQTVGHRERWRLGGLTATMPRFSRVSAIGFLSAMGLPGLCGFVGQFLVLMGLFQAVRADSILRGHEHASRITLCLLAVLACVGLVLRAGALLSAFQSTFLGPRRSTMLKDPELRKIWPMLLLASLAVLLGVMPAAVVLAPAERSIDAMFTELQVASAKP